MRKAKGSGGRERFWVDGRYVGEPAAKISVLDRGLLFGDSLYEVVRFYDRKLFLLGDHLDRLFREAAAIALPRPFTREQIARAIRGLVQRSDKADGMVLLHWTRGAGPRRLAPPDGLEGSCFAIRLELPSIPSGFRRRGVDVITLPDDRWAHTHIKSTNLLPNVLARREALAAGAYEAILHRGRGSRARVTEGTSSTVFLVLKGVLVTPAVRGLLPGITRSTVLFVAREAGVPAEERDVRLGELTGADEVFLTATSTEILPVRRVNGAPLRLEAPGPLTRRVTAEFTRFRRRILATTPGVPGV